ncbi:hypothetical protein BOTBODRAFT_30469 [Botryobasidium botryosum FD-172 SS1]|uniref:Uncharacterized protein n=1 Tax=Botryobasidium botryosum (strain FD-172 SS1) TaxID=930990 RepID=A0A067MYV1_BOTB1|nr:hypothetical protein BOTBODRAFT_30469 [Botryobasidium botryosum FD-172 SS1]
MSSRRTSATSTSSHRSHSGGATAPSPHQRAGSGRFPVVPATSAMPTGLQSASPSPPNSAVATRLCLKYAQVKCCTDGSLSP